MSVETVINTTHLHAAPVSTRAEQVLPFWALLLPGVSQGVDNVYKLIIFIIQADYCDNIISQDNYLVDLKIINSTW